MTLEALAAIPSPEAGVFHLSYPHTKDSIFRAGSWCPAYGMVSALELLEHKADAFCRLSSLVGQMIAAFQLGSAPTSRNFGGIMGELQRESQRLGLRIVDQQLNRIREQASVPGVNLRDLRPSIEELYNRLMDSLSDHVFLAVPSDRADFYRQKDPPFGKQVQDRFPSVIDEIGEAAKCYALGRATASAFHSIRCLEAGISGLSRCLTIPDPTKASDRNWGQVLRKIKEETDRRWPTSIAKLSGDGEFFENAYAALAAMQNPWRNATMHLDQKYTDEEAKHIFDVVKGFMVKIASRLDETGQPLA